MQKLVIKDFVKDPVVAGFVKKMTEYGNLILNDVPVDEDGKIVVKKEKERSDGKLQRGYYTARFISMDNINKSIATNMWQTLSSDGKSLVWKDLSPTVAPKFLGANLAGHVLEVEYTQEYDITNPDGRTTVTNKTNLFVGDLQPETIESTLRRDIMRHGWIVTENSEQEDDTKQEDNPDKVVINTGVGAGAEIED